METLSKEFPFLNKIELYDVRNMEHFSVEEINPSILRYTPKWKTAVGSMVNIREEDCFHFVYEAGIIIEDAVEHSGTRINNYAPGGGRNHYNGETVMDAITRHGIDGLQYIINVKSGYNVSNHYSQPGWELRIYKLPEGKTIRDIVDNA
jgi:hypothetical protein